MDNGTTVQIGNLPTLLSCTSTVVNFNLLYGKCIHAYSRNLKLYVHMICCTCVHFVYILLYYLVPLLW